MQKFDRILDRHDVIELLFIDQINNRCQRGTLTAACRSGNQDDAVFQLRYFPQLRWQIEIVESRRSLWDHAHDDRMRASLLENIDPKA